MKTVIVGAGISGLATAHALLTLQPRADVVVLEAGRRAGGKVRTEWLPEGYACEWGVNGFLNNKPRTLELAGELDLRALPGRADADRRYVYRHGELHRLPESPPAFLTSRLLSVRGRLRVLCEPFIGRAAVEDESLADFASRRLGREALEALIDPMASGVFAGDPRRMSLKSCFPRVHMLESEYGSLVRGMIRLQVKARREGRAGPGAGPGGKLTSFAEGMSALTDRLAARLGARLRLGVRVEQVSRAGGLYQVHWTDGAEEAEQVILAAPAHAQAGMLKELVPEASALLAGIGFPALAVVCLGYRQQDLGVRPDGFGFLVPSAERRTILGTVFDSNVFPNRAPEGSVLLRSMVGGAHAPERARLPEHRLVDLVRSELRGIMGVDAEPEFAMTHCHERAIPQYAVGHSERLQDIGDHLRRHPGLHLTGNSFRGVSLNDCVENAWRTARTVVSVAA